MSTSTVTASRLVPAIDDEPAQHVGRLEHPRNLAFPSHVAGLILCGTYPVFNFADKLIARMSRHVDAEIVQSAFAGPIADDQTFADVFPTILPGYFHEWEPAIGGDDDPIMPIDEAYTPCARRFQTRPASCSKTAGTSRSPSAPTPSSQP